MRKFLIPAIKTQILAIKNPDSSPISRRSNEILIESSEISSNPMRLKPDLAKSHRLRWDFRRIWVFFTFSRSFLAIFSPFSQIFDVDRHVRAPVEVWSARPIYSCGQRWVSFSKTQFRRVGSGLGINSARTNPWPTLILITLYNIRLILSLTVYCLAGFFRFFCLLCLHCAC